MQKEALTDDAMQSIALSIVGNDTEGLLQFSRVSTSSELARLGRFRLHHYPSKKSYMLAALNQYGLDHFDEQADIYVATIRNEIVASIRLCQNPFETEQFIHSDVLAAFLGEDYQAKYLEWSRLLVNHQADKPRLLQALIVYAGLNALASGSKHHYFGYSTGLVKRLFRRFKLSDQAHEFVIPERGDHHYYLIKGDFVTDLHHLMNKETI